jgi:hypothetical protein
MREVNTMEENHMLYFKYPWKFRQFLIENKLYNSWLIEEGLMNKRGNAIREKEYYKVLSGIFNEKELFRKKVSIAEVVTWLDSFVHVNRLITHLKDKLSIDEYKNLEIYFEYVIKLSKKSRIDCIIKYKNNYCLLEFKTINNFNLLKSSYDKKRLELMIYKDMLSNYFDKSSKLIVYPFIGLHEYKFKKLIEKHYEYNLSQSEYASEYIIEFLLK